MPLSQVFCVYDGPEPGDSNNAFQFTVPSNRAPLLSDLQRSFPLGSSYAFSVYSGSGIFLDVANPAEPLPALRDGVLKVQVAPLAAAPLVSREAVRERAASGPPRQSQQQQQQRQKSSVSSAPHTDDGGRRGSGGSSGAGAAGIFSDHRRQASGGSAGSGGGGGGGGSSAGGVGIEGAGKAVLGLLSHVGRAAQGLAEQLTAQEISVGVYRVQVVRQLAEGGFSKVSLARDPSTGRFYALKEMLCQDRDSAELAQREVAVLRAVRHRNVIQLLDQASVPSKRSAGAREFYLLFPFFERGTAWDAIVRADEAGAPGPFPETAALRLFLDACNGTQAMHAKSYAHRDIKPLNILIADDGAGVMMDVGSACAARREVTSRQEALVLEDEAAIYCSAPYRAPELTSVNPGVPVDERVDVWSLGCTLYALAFGHSPFETPREGVQKLAILNGKFTFPQGRRRAGNVYSQEFCDLVTWVLQPDPRQRATLAAVIERTQGLLRR